MCKPGLASQNRLLPSNGFGLGMQNIAQERSKKLARELKENAPELNAIVPELNAIAPELKAIVPELNFRLAS